jgi:hypothetical protein
MADLQLDRSDYVRFVLQLEDIKTLELEDEPIGWANDDLEIVRNKKYHGIVTQFTSGLKFIGHEKDFILDAYKQGGINANVYLIKYTFRQKNNYVEGLTSQAPLDWEERYRGIADFNTLAVKDNKLTINFNSDELEELVKNHETDDFEIDRATTIDDVELPLRIALSPTQDQIFEFNKNYLAFSGRWFERWGEATNAYFTGEFTQSSFPGTINGAVNFNKFTIPTQFRGSEATDPGDGKGFPRHVEVTSQKFDRGDSLAWQGNFFYNDSLNPYEFTEVYVEYDFKIKIDKDNDGVSDSNQHEIWLVKYEFKENPDSEDSNEWGYYHSASELMQTINDNEWTQCTGSKTFHNGVNMPHTMALALEFRTKDVPFLSTYHIKWRVSPAPNEKYQVKVKEVSRWQAVPYPSDIVFLHEAGTRLMEIITSKPYKFYSKLLARRDYAASAGVKFHQHYFYQMTGEIGEVALIHGFSARVFYEGLRLYKPMTLSLKDFIEALQATFNVGVGIEDSPYGQRLRIEKLEYFYRDSIVVKLPNQIIDVQRSVEKEMFYSGLEFGADKGGDYEEGMGLDEPNVKAQYITPLRKTKNKYEKVSKIRSDMYGLEVLRRKPSYLDATEDMAGDDNIWYVDCKIGVDGTHYEQKHWSDALQSAPTGVFHPETYSSWRFTPKRSLLRHGWVIRAGMENIDDLGKKITISSSDSNIDLVTQLKQVTNEYGDVVQEAETEPLKEQADIKVNKLERARILPELIKFKHPIDDDLYDLIMGTTAVEINREVENVRNYYFKFQWINENGEFETGYLKSFKPKNNEFEFWKANENIIY